MRRRDKSETIRKANILAEQRHLKSNSLVREGFDPKEAEHLIMKQGSLDLQSGRETQNVPIHKVQIHDGLIWINLGGGTNTVVLKVEGDNIKVLDRNKKVTAWNLSANQGSWFSSLISQLGP